MRTLLIAKGNGVVKRTGPRRAKLRGGLFVTDKSRRLPLSCCGRGRRGRASFACSRSVVFVGGFRHNSHSLDAGVDVGFNAGFARLQLEGMPASFR